MKVLVTGGAGYIGSHTVRQLHGAGHDVVVLDTLEFGRREAVGDTPFVQGDTGDTALVERVLRDERIEAVIHFAAYKSVGDSMQQPGRYFQNNVCGTLNLLTAMTQAQVKYIVFSSTCAVYGTPETLPVSETNAIHPESVYGETKVMVERLLHWFDATTGLRSAALRYFNAAGASFDATLGEDWTYTLNLVPLVMKAALGHLPTLKIFGSDYPTSDGTAIRDYIHVVDLADAHVKALEFLQREDRSDVFNLGTGHGSSVQQIINAAREVSGLPIPVEYAERRPGDPVASWADNTKARTLLGWTPQYGLREIVETAWQWHHTHHGFAK